MYWLHNNCVVVVADLTALLSKHQSDLSFNLYRLSDQVNAKLRKVVEKIIKKDNDDEEPYFSNSIPWPPTICPPLQHHPYHQAFISQQKMQISLPQTPSKISQVSSTFLLSLPQSQKIPRLVFLVQWRFTLLFLLMQPCKKNLGIFSSVLAFSSSFSSLPSLSSSSSSTLLFIFTKN